MKYYMQPYKELQYELKKSHCFSVSMKRQKEAHIAALCICFTPNNELIFDDINNVLLLNNPIPEAPSFS